MAKRADADTVAADMSPPNYRAAVQRLRGIKAKKEKIAGINGEIADIYAKTEGNKVNKVAARIFMMIDPKEHPDRLDILRSLNGLFDAAGWEEESQDLADRAEGTVVRGRFATGPDEGDGEDPPADPIGASAKSDEGVAGVSKKEIVKRANAKAIQSLANAKRHLGGKPMPDPYTGDNSDLGPQDGSKPH